MTTLATNEAPGLIFAHPVHMNTAQTSEYLQVPVETLRSWRHRGRGEGPRWFKLGHRVMYRRADVDAFVDAAVDQAAAG